MRFWPRKEEAPLNMKASETLPTLKACETCGCLIAVGRGKQVRQRTWDETLSYCEGEGCAPPYDEISVNRSTGEPHYYRREPARLVEVTEKGKPFKAEAK